MNQQTLWNTIAPEWHEYKKKPSKLAIEFLKKQKGNILDFGSGSGRHLIKTKDKTEKTSRANKLSGGRASLRGQTNFNAEEGGRDGFPSKVASLEGSERSFPNSQFHLLDFSEKMIELAKQKAKRLNMTSGSLRVGSNRVGTSKQKNDVEFTVADMKKTPYPDNFFDSAISISAIHCTPKKDHKKIIKELHRVLKPKAKTLIGVWNKESKRFKNAKSKEKLIGWTDKGKRYYYLFEEKEIHNLFKKAGFKILSTHNSEMMLNFIVEK